MVCTELHKMLECLTRAYGEDIFGHFDECVFADSIATVGVRGQTPVQL
jgi:hypothetical protein